jgi:hypothetical protein
MLRAPAPLRKRSEWPARRGLGTFRALWRNRTTVRDFERRQAEPRVIAGGDGTRIHCTPIVNFAPAQRTMQGNNFWLETKLNEGKTQV